ncbi:putative RING-H2 finger protein atl21a [Phtheirospermum japonicum]|uniref:RING-type E3 ubiquitin transferase n=1 Tax=Phtheirospermum japonicum TaxID=374723 RepID=A0A830DCP1_9LAMI|nr:putative RING-H2 finger protein atl21a [Phtheirospermum japonicum]
MLVFLIFIFLSLLFPVLVLEAGRGDCQPITCRKHGPIIQFPFRHKYLHPEYCGYPGFDVYCNENKNTVLALPFSVDFIVKKINYVSQEVHLYDPGKCLLKKLPHLNLSASPFDYPEYYLSDYNLFNCTASTRDLDNLITCLSDSSNKFYAIDSATSMDSLSSISCTKIHELSSVPRNIVHRNDLHLNWLEPACGGCEAQGKKCSFKNYTTGHQIQCINKPNTKKQGILAKKNSYVVITNTQ